ACISEMGLTSRLDPEAARRLSQFQELIDIARRDLMVGRGMQAIEALIEGINYRGWLSDQSSSEPMAERRWGNVLQLLEALKKDLKNVDDDPETAEETDDDTAIEAAIRKLVLRDILEREEEEDDSDRVQLATLHAAKGLEFPDVFLMGVEEELLPHKNSVEAETIEEERRLMYVGITRAKQQLTITYAKKRKQFGEFLETTPSRFLDELPDEHVHWHGRDELDPEVARQKGQDTLSALAALLKGESA
ncbi:MAG TPA: ATP-dependent DNA helicase Rep, partial [Gammaproteobacteria bacterium]|nr:ATP-dependent DNA helicase Rep [Gammaproteobacteria bacterium]